MAAILVLFIFYPGDIDGHRNFIFGTYKHTCFSYVYIKCLVIVTYIFKVGANLVFLAQL